MAYAPCKNPNCKSFGRPHPNCRCYDHLAKGGMVGDFCSESRLHDEGCEYFADGGEVSPDDVVMDAPQGLDESVVPDDQVSVENPGTAFDEIPDDQVQVADEEVPEDQVQMGPAKDYEQPAQQIAAGVEGLGQGVGGPFFTGAEKIAQKVAGHFGQDIGMSDEDIVGRQEANPTIHGAGEIAGVVGSTLAGEGLLPLAAKAIEPVVQAARMSKVGSAIVRGAILNNVISASDDVSKWLLGQGDQSEPVGALMAKVPMRTFLGGVSGGIFGTAEQVASNKLKQLAESKIGYKMESFLAGIAFASGAGENMTGEGIAYTGQATNPLSSEYDKKMFEIGNKFFHSTLQGAVKGLAAPFGAAAGSMGGPMGSMAGTIAGAIFGKSIGKTMTKAAEKYVAPSMLNILQSDRMGGVIEALDHAETVAAGMQCVKDGVERVFDLGALGATKTWEAYKDEKDRAKLDKIISNGGYNQQIQQQLYQNNAPGAPAPEQGFAEGGEVVSPSNVTQSAPTNQPSENGVAIHYPEQNMLLSAAKGRVSNYLMSLKPNPNPPKLAFDDMPDNREAQKTYVKALDIANQPLGILKEIKEGTVEPEHVKHFNAMYPELNKLLQKQMTDKILQMQLKNVRPPAKVRQGLSMFMGTPLSGEFQPQNIQAAQGAYAKPGAASPMDQPQKPKSQSGGSRKALSNSDRSYLTNGQALVRRQQKI